MKIVKNIVYIKPGIEGTADLIGVVAERVKELNIAVVAVASSNGKSAVKIAETLKGVAKVMSVTEFAYGDEVKSTMKKLGVTAIERADLPIQDRREVREALLMFGASVKAALEVASIAAEKEASPPSKMIAVAGGGGSLDTALVVRPARPTDLFSVDPSKRMIVLEIVALPLSE